MAETGTAARPAGVSSSGRSSPRSAATMAAAGIPSAAAERSTARARATTSPPRASASVRNRTSPVVVSAAGGPADQSRGMTRKGRPVYYNLRGSQMNGPLSVTAPTLIR